MSQVVTPKVNLFAMISYSACAESGTFIRVFRVVTFLILRRHLEEFFERSLVSLFSFYGTPWLITCLPVFALAFYNIHDHLDSLRYICITKV